MINKNRLQELVKLKSESDGRLLEDKLYELSIDELKMQQIDEVAFAKAKEEAQGNLEKTEAFYPKHRARRIKDEMENFLLGEIISDQENNSPEAQKLKQIEGLKLQLKDAKTKLTKHNTNIFLFFIFSAILTGIFYLYEFQDLFLPFLIITLLSILYGFVKGMSLEKQIEKLEREIEQRSRNKSSKLFVTTFVVLVIAIIALVFFG